MEDLSRKSGNSTTPFSSHHHQCLPPLSGHRPRTRDFHPFLSWAILPSSLHPYPRCFMSLSTHLFQVSWGLPRRLAPCGFHWSACLVVLVAGFLNVWPIHLHLRIFISSAIGLSPVLSQMYSFFTLSYHLILMIFRRQPLMNVWTFLMIVSVVFHVSLPYSKTALTFGLTSRNSVRRDILLDLQTLRSNWMNAFLAFSNS